MNVICASLPLSRSVLAVRWRTSPVGGKCPSAACFFGGFVDAVTCTSSTRHCGLWTVTKYKSAGLDMVTCVQLFFEGTQQDGSCGVDKAYDVQTAELRAEMRCGGHCLCCLQTLVHGASSKALPPCVYVNGCGKCYRYSLKTNTNNVD